MKKIISTLAVGFILISCTDYKANPKSELNQKETKQTNKMAMDTITLGAGCFWCVEAIFDEIKGVDNVVSGYAGGAIKNPSYKEVCAGTTGHAEVCQLTYDPEIVSLAKLLEVFWQVHDPTTLNRQGGDIGTQYRSAIFYHNEDQKEVATKILTKLNEEQVFVNPIVTEITAFTNFYPAEDYHQDYLELNGDNPYCKAVVRPKVDKFKKTFSEILK